MMHFLRIWKALVSFEHLVLSATGHYIKLVVWSSHWARIFFFAPRPVTCSAATIVKRHVFLAILSPRSLGRSLGRRLFVYRAVLCDVMRADQRHR